MNVGWTAAFGSNYMRRGQLPRILRDYMATFGGEEEGVTWVYSCVDLIASELAAYPWEVTDQEDKTIEPQDLPEELKTLLEHPNGRLTYFDMTYLMAADLELTGNSYWLKDNMNGKGQPESLFRLRPEFVRIAVDTQDIPLGFIYEVLGMSVPYELDEVIHFRYPTPTDDHYGMGTVEALQRALGAELAENDHISGFFNNGARISGILTTDQLLSEVQWQRMKQDFAAEFGGSGNAFKILIAEQGTDFKPITVAPAGTGVIELRRMTKDEILAGFGVPEFLLGGIGQGGVYKMEEAQNILSRKMMPKARRFQERMTIDLIDLWGMKFKVDESAAEPMTQRLSQAGQLMGAGASLNEVRRRVGLPEFEHEDADTPLIPAGFTVFGKEPAAPPGMPGDPAALGLPPGATQADAEIAAEEEAAPPDMEGQVPPEEEQPGAVTMADQEKGAGALTLGAKAVVPPFDFPATSISPPDFPEGTERLGEVRSANPALAAALLGQKARTHRRGYREIEEGFRELFLQQRDIIIERLMGYDSQHNVKRLERVRGKQVKMDKKQLTVQQLWDPDEMDALLQEMYLGLVDVLGSETMTEVGQIISSGAGVPLSAMPVWDPLSEAVAAIRTSLAKDIRRVNDTTREKIADAIAEGTRRGYSITQIANGYPAEKYRGIQGVFDSATAHRAETIARTETGKIHNAVALNTYGESGVEMVEVLDGEGCGWIGHDDPVKANGRVVSLADAGAAPLSHPNCVRSFIPLIATPLKKAWRQKGEHSGSIVMWKLDADTASALALPGGESVADLHMTLVYLDSEPELERLASAVHAVAGRFRPLVARVNGPGRFIGTDVGQDAYVALVDDPDLPALHHALVEALEREGLKVSRRHGFIPHITLSYLDSSRETPRWGGDPGPLEIGALTVAVGDHSEEIPLSGIETKAGFDPSQPRDATGRWSAADNERRTDPKKKPAVAERQRAMSERIKKMVGAYPPGSFIVMDKSKKARKMIQALAELPLGMHYTLASIGVTYAVGNTALTAMPGMEKYADALTPDGRPYSEIEGAYDLESNRVYVSTKWQPTFLNKYVLYHEIGHSLNENFGYAADPEIVAEYDRLRAEGMIGDDYYKTDTDLGYAVSGRDEYVATVMAYIMNPLTRPHVGDFTSPKMVELVRKKLELAWWREEG